MIFFHPSVFMRMQTFFCHVVVYVNGEPCFYVRVLNGKMLYFYRRTLFQVSWRARLGAEGHKGNLRLT